MHAPRRCHDRRAGRWRLLTHAGAHRRRQVGGGVRARRDRRRALLPQGRCPPSTTGSCAAPATRRTGSTGSGRPGSTTVPRRSSTTPWWRWRSKVTDPQARLAILMADCADDLVPPGDDRCRSSSTTASSSTWPRSTPPSSDGATRSGCRISPGGSCGSHRRRSPRSCASTTCLGRSPRPPRGGRDCPTAARSCTSSSAASTPTRAHLPPPSPRRRRRSSPATGSSATSVPVAMAARSSSTGPTRARRRRAGSWRGTWRSTAIACRDRRRRRSPPTAAVSSSMASTRRAGGTASSACAWSG